MTMEDFRLFHEKNFDSFSKSTIKSASARIRKELAAQAEREVELSALPFQAMQQLCTEDTYPVEEECVAFSVQGRTVIVHDGLLARALFSLPPKRRDVLLLFYFVDKNEPQIGRLLHISTSAVNRRRSTALNRLKEILEAMDYGA